MLSKNNSRKKIVNMAHVSKCFGTLKCDEIAVLIMYGSNTTFAVYVDKTCWYCQFLINQSILVVCQLIIISFTDGHSWLIHKDKR